MVYVGDVAINKAVHVVSVPVRGAGQLQVAAVPAGRVGAGAGADARAALPRRRARASAAGHQVSARRLSYSY